MFKSALITTLAACCREVKVKLAERIEEAAKVERAKLFHLVFVARDSKHLYDEWATIQH